MMFSGARQKNDVDILKLCLIHSARHYQICNQPDYTLFSLSLTYHLLCALWLIDVCLWHRHLTSCSPLFAPIVLLQHLLTPLLLPSTISLLLPPTCLQWGLKCNINRVAIKKLFLNQALIFTKWRNSSWLSRAIALTCNDGDKTTVSRRVCRDHICITAPHIQRHHIQQRNKLISLAILFLTINIFLNLE